MHRVLFKCCSNFNIRVSVFYILTFWFRGIKSLQTSDSCRAGHSVVEDNNIFVGYGCYYCYCNTNFLLARREFCGNNQVGRPSMLMCFSLQIANKQLSFVKLETIGIIIFTWKATSDNSSIFFKDFLVPKWLECYGFKILFFKTDSSIYHFWSLFS